MRALAWSVACACASAAPPQPHAVAVTQPVPVAAPIVPRPPDPAPPEKLEPGCLARMFATRSPNSVQSGPRFAYAWWFPESGSASHVVRFDAQGAMFEVNEIPKPPPKPAQPQWHAAEPLVVTIGDRRLTFDREPHFGAADDHVAAFVVGDRAANDCVLETRDIATNTITNGAGVPRGCGDQVKAVLGASVLLHMPNAGMWRSILVDARSGREILSSSRDPDIVPLGADGFALLLQDTNEIVVLDRGALSRRTKLPVPPGWSAWLAAAGGGVIAIGPGGERVVLDAAGPHLLPAPPWCAPPTVEPSTAAACLPADSRIVDHAMFGANLRYCTDANTRTCLEFDVARRRFSSLTIVPGAHSDPLDVPDLGAPRSPRLRRVVGGVEICDDEGCRTLAVDGEPRALSPSRERLALAVGNALQLRDSRSGALLAEIATPSHIDIWLPQWMGNDRLLLEGAIGASGHADDVIVDVTGKTLSKLGGHEVGARAIHVGGDTWAIFLPHESVSIYDVRAGKRQRIVKLPKQLGEIFAVAAGSAKTMLLVGSSGEIASVDLARGTVVVARPPVCP
jgi:hypothetical protein